MKPKIFAYPSLLSMGLLTAFAQNSTPATASDRFVPVSLGALVQKAEGAKAEVETLTRDGVPFSVIDRGSSLLSLSQAGWPEQKEDPSNYYEKYDNAAAYVGVPSMPLVEVPRGDYIAAYLLGWADPDDKTVNTVTLRMGSRLGAGANVDSLVWTKDFGGIVPRALSAAGTPALTVTRIPITEALGQDVIKDVMNLEITKEIRLAVRAPDPCRYRWRPLGLPSGVKIAAITLERSPIQMEINATTFGALFELPSQPEYVVKLRNITAQDQKFTLSLTLADGKKQSIDGVIPARKNIEQNIKFSDVPLGYHSVTITLEMGGRPLLTRATAFGVIPKNDRQYAAESPLGTWTFGGTHCTPSDDDRVGELFKKLGLRYGMFASTTDMRAKYGVVRGNDPGIGTGPAKTLESYDALKAKSPDTLPSILVFHETAISGAHATRVPDLFVDRPAYVMNDAEKKSFAELTELAMGIAKLFREKHPEVKLNLGNGNPVLREEFYRNKFPTELFDTAGNEAASFMRPPETQPPDIVANNATLWMDRQLLDAYGYKDKAVSQCFEISYPSSNPGNLSLQTQADYFIRNILHSMTWGIPKIRVGIISDAANSYYYGNWGASGFFTRLPDVTPKPAALAIATLTRVLDGAQYENYIETGSDSAYLLRFKKKDNSIVLVYWVVRGARDYALTFDAVKDVVKIEETGETTKLPVQDGKVTVVATSSPGYLELPAGASFKNIALGAPTYKSKPEGNVSPLSALGSLAGWKVENKRNAGLELYNPMEPRRLGKFSFDPVTEFEGRPALRVTPQPLTSGKAPMPMYAELVRDKGIPLPGTPTQLGLWVNGNSSWGRIIYELEDASGQKWVSIGAKAAENSRWMADWLTPEMQKQFKPGDQADWNTDDAFAFSRINFDGWKYVSFPLPGQYPGEGYHWPSNSNWNWDKDGIVHYPLTLKKIIVQLPEKTLYLSRFEPAKRPSIYLNDLVSVESAVPYPVKTVPGEYVEEAQKTMD